MLETLREELRSACQMMEEYDLSGILPVNISAVDRANSLIVIKPADIKPGDVLAEDFIITDLSGNIVEGSHSVPPGLMTHIELYKAFDSISSIVHTHSENATVWAQAGRDIPPYGVTHAQYFRGYIPCTRSLTQTEIENNYEEQLAVSICEAFSERGIDFLDIPGALVFNHGPITWGKDALSAVKHAVILERIAKMAYQTELINSEIMPINKSVLEKQFLKQHS